MNKFNLKDCLLIQLFIFELPASVTAVTMLQTTVSYTAKKILAYKILKKYPIL